MALTRIDDVDWLNWTPAQRATLTFIVRNDDVLLIRKKAWSRCREDKRTLVDASNLAKRASGLRRARGRGGGLRHARRSERMR